MASETCQCYSTLTEPKNEEKFETDAKRGPNSAICQGEHVTREKATITPGVVTAPYPTEVCEWQAAGQAIFCWVGEWPEPPSIQLPPNIAENPFFENCLRVGQSPRKMKKPVPFRLDRNMWAFRKHWTEAQEAAEAMLQATEAKDLMELGIAADKLEQSLGELWNLREGRDIDWQTILNHMQGIMRTFFLEKRAESLTADQCKRIVELVKDYLSPATKTVDDLNEVLQLIDDAGFDPYAANSGPNARREQTMTDLNARLFTALGGDWPPTQPPWEGLIRLYGADPEAFYLLACDGVRSGVGSSFVVLAELAEQVRMMVRGGYRLVAPSEPSGPAVKNTKGNSLPLPPALFQSVRKFLLDIDGKGTLAQKGRDYEGRAVTEAEVRFKLGSG